MIDLNSVKEADRQEIEEVRLLKIMRDSPELLKGHGVVAELFYSDINQALYKKMVRCTSNDELNEAELEFNLTDDEFCRWEQVKDTLANDTQFNNYVNQLKKVKQYKEAFKTLYQGREADKDINICLEHIKSIANDWGTEKPTQKPTNEEIYRMVRDRGNLLQFTNAFKGLRDKVGFRQEVLTVISARPSIGKSAFALNLFNDLSKCQAYKCVYVNMEMTKEEIYQRLVGMNSREIINNIPYMKPGSESDERVKATIRELNARGMTIASQRMSVEEVKATVTQEQNENPGKHIILFIDYLGYITTDKKFYSEQERLEYVMKEINGITKQYNCTIFLLAQQNRSGAKVVSNENLRGSGEIEQSAHCVLLLDDLDEFNNSKPTHLMKIKITKNRSGDKGEAYMNYHKTTQLFTECTWQEAQDKLSKIKSDKFEQEKEKVKNS